MKKLLITTMAVLILGVVAFTQTDPFQTLLGPVSKVEEWSYTVEEEFGNAVEVWDAHSVTMYNTDKNPIESIHYTETGSIGERYIRTFDSSGQLIQVVKYNWLGGIEGKTFYTYEGKIQITRSYDGSGHLKSATDVELDEHGNSIQVTDYDVDSGDIALRGYNTYTADGEPLSTRIYDDKGEIFMEMDWQYDVGEMSYTVTGATYLLGNVFMKTESRMVPNKTDEHGNWTEERKYEHKERFGKTEWALTNIYRREITYR